ncbi:MAG: CPBP family intramembrane glutamic endopeptidase [Bacteroidota bacterium]
MSDASSVPASEAPPAAPPAPEADALVDAWPNARPFRLDGWLERNGFRPIWTALLVLISGFVAFNVVGGVFQAFAIIPDLLAASEGADIAQDDIMAAMADNIDAVLIGNTVGQFVGLALFTWLVVRLHTRQRAPYLRLRVPDGPALALSAVGWVVMVPAIQWLGTLNQKIPLPERLKRFEEVQIDFINGALLGGDISTLALFFGLAITPSLCEELFFRGYIQRQVERKWGALASILIVGIVFGLYHFRLSQAIPLSLLGIYMGYVVWATGSLWSGFLVHLLNNGFAVVVAGWARSTPDVDLEAIEAAGVPWYYGVLGLLLAAGVSVLLHKRRLAVVGERPDAQPVAAAAPLSPTPLPTP